MKKVTMLVLPLIASLWLVVSSAFAQTHYNLPNSGTVLIGQSSGQPGTAYAHLMRANGVCTRLKLGDGGLTGFTVLNAHSNSGNSISFASTGQDFCGYWVRPLITNGFRITVNGGTGDDFIYNAVTRAATVSGQPGNDILVNFPSDSGTYPLWGGGGNDRMYCDDGDYAYGHAGDDTFCTTNGLPELYDGGTGSNSQCGPANQVYSATLVPNCACL